MAITRFPVRVDASDPAGGDTAPAPDLPAVGFVALSRFEIANGMVAEVRAAFRDRPHLVEGAPGFRRMEVISPIDQPEQIWLFTFWTDEASYRTWHRSHLYRESHKGIPGGLKLVPGATELRYFNHFAS